MATRPDELVDLTTAPNEPAAAVIKSVLEDNGIDAILVSAPLTVSAYFGNAVVPTCVRVRQEDLGRAQQVLNQNREDSVDLDWDEVDVGDPEDPLAAAIAARTDDSSMLHDASVYNPMIFTIVLAVLIDVVAIIVGSLGFWNLSWGMFWASFLLYGLAAMLVVRLRGRWKRSRRSNSEQLMR